MCTHVHTHTTALVPEYSILKYGKAQGLSTDAFELSQILTLLFKV